MSRFISIFILITALALVSPTFASNAPRGTNVSAGLTLAEAPLAIHGYDPVAFFEKGEALIGSDEHLAVYRDAAYRFVNEADKQAFERSPEKYAPQYGGFCAYGVAVGHKFDGDPRVFKIVDGKLYFNLNPEIQKKWAQDVPGHIRTADKNWTTIRDKDPREL